MKLTDIAASNPFSRPNSGSVAADAGLVEFGSSEYYAKCMFAGSLSCGLTHTAVVPLDLVKCRMQVDSVKYPSLPKGLKVRLFPKLISSLDYYLFRLPLLRVV